MGLLLALNPDCSLAVIFSALCLPIQDHSNFQHYFTKITDEDDVSLVLAVLWIPLFSEFRDCDN